MSEIDMASCLFAQNLRWCCMWSWSGFAMQGDFQFDC